MNVWNTIYERFDPIAFSIGGIEVHWYGLAYACAIIIAFYMALRMIKNDPKRFPIERKDFESYFLWAELGIVLGARIGYILIYDPNSSYYLMHFWQIFNPFDSEGNFVGIRGMSYHGGLVGFLVASYLYSRKDLKKLLIYLDLIAISLPLGYVFGRIGNFLNQELFGRIVPENSHLGQMIGIVINNELRYPSQLIEAFLEGIVVFFMVMLAKKYTKTHGLLIVIYGLGYSLMRFLAEFYREPDSQMGVYIFNLSMGQILSLFMVIVSLGILLYAKKYSKIKEI
ncbi:prolipoprotein diacylglyceryl transferase [Helicobacter cetorum]|uniref:Phosphatidylglycerol--prolipoprotein diacylglyceryl transferase n=1 Tax=Helicobacter cetorum (strain ATCC BAA-429 / MIT 00-7128) TaxID=182217 RepID=I0EN61_HELC0|nr:prolipoprotein diacylglyceryl transferase [Helicobacter cetorum]AFI04380.1 prolipoprotein diacylglyceryl transferase [Helicobacter cetorum MIT 00-7128]